MTHAANKVNAKREYQIGAALPIIHHYLANNNGVEAARYLANLDDADIKDAIIIRAGLNDAERAAMGIMTRRQGYALEMALRQHADNGAAYRRAQIEGREAHYDAYGKVTGEAVDYYLELAA